jgi:hypothetical protein
MLRLVGTLLLALAAGSAAAQPGSAESPNPGGAALGQIDSEASRRVERGIREAPSLQVSLDGRPLTFPMPHDTGGVALGMNEDATRAAIRSLAGSRNVQIATQPSIIISPGGRVVQGAGIIADIRGDAEREQLFIILQQFGTNNQVVSITRRIYYTQGRPFWQEVVNVIIARYGEIFLRTYAAPRFGRRIRPPDAEIAEWMVPAGRSGQGSECRDIDAEINAYSIHVSFFSNSPVFWPYSGVSLSDVVDGSPVFTSMGGRVDGQIFLAIRGDISSRQRSQFSPQMQRNGEIQAAYERCALLVRVIPFGDDRNVLGALNGGRVFRLQIQLLAPGLVVEAGRAHDRAIEAAEEAQREQDRLEEQRRRDLDDRVRGSRERGVGRL